MRTRHVGRCQKGTVESKDGKMAFLGDVETTFASVIEWLYLHHASKQKPHCIQEMVARFLSRPIICAT